MRVKPPRQDGGAARPGVVRYDRTDSAFGIARDILKQRFVPLILPALAFMVFSGLVLLAVLSFRTPETAGEYALNVYPPLFVGIVALGVPMAWIWVRSMVMLMTTTYLKGERSDFNRIGVRALQCLPAAFGAYFFAALATVILSVLLVLPGVVIALRQYFIIPAVLFEDATAFNAEKRSAAATKGRYLEIFLGGLGGGLAGLLVAAMAVDAVANLTLSETFPEGSVKKLVLLIVAWPLIGTFTSMQRVIRYWRYTAEPRTESQLRRGPSPFAQGAAATA